MRAERAIVADVSRFWWVFLVTGVLWFLVALVVLRFDVTSLVAVGVLLGVVFLGAALNEFLVAAIRRSWRWIHALVGVILLAGAIWAFIEPVDAFWSLAAALGFLLVLKGSVDITSAVMTREFNDLWVLGLIVGILEVLLAFWVSQQLFPARATLILIWVGFMAMFRGFSEIVTAFLLRRVEVKVAAVPASEPPAVALS